MMGEPSSELQQYLHLPGQPSVGMIITWNGFFIMLFSLRQGIRVFVFYGRAPARRSRD
jgi:uncharacterized protein YybS (DUF2232 family)